MSKGKLIYVRHRKTGEVQGYSTDAREAVLGAYALEHKCGNTWQWEQRFGRLPVLTPKGWVCGEWEERTPDPA